MYYKGASNENMDTLHGQKDYNQCFACMQWSIIHRKWGFIYLMGTVKYLFRVACLKDDDMKIFIFASATTQTLLCFQWAFTFSSVCVQHKALNYNNQYVFTCTLKHLNMSNAQGQKSPTPLMFLQIYRLPWWFKIQMA